MTVYVFGDSWGMSYLYTGSYGDKIIPGNSIAELLENKFNVHGLNFSERGLNNFQILKNVIDKSAFFKPSDIIIILQTDLLRGMFSPWWKTNDILFYKSILEPDFFTKKHTLVEIIEYIANLVYDRINKIAQFTTSKIILAGGCTRLNHQLALKHNITFIDKSFTEIITPGFKDNYSFDEGYCARTLDDLSKLDFYKSIREYEMQYIEEIGQKHQVWRNDQVNYVFNHASPAGNKIVVDYIYNFLSENKLI